MLGLKLREMFYLIGDIQKTYFSKQEADSPVTLKVYLGNQAHLFAFSTYRITDWLIDMGGISKAIFFGPSYICGKILNHMDVD